MASTVENQTWNLEPEYTLKIALLDFSLIAEIKKYYSVNYYEEINPYSDCADGNVS